MGRRALLIIQVAGPPDGPQHYASHIGVRVCAGVRMRACMRSFSRGNGSGRTSARLCKGASYKRRAEGSAQLHVTARVRCKEEPPLLTAKPPTIAHPAAIHVDANAKYTNRRPFKTSSKGSATRRCGTVMYRRCQEPANYRHACCSGELVLAHRQQRLHCILAGASPSTHPTWRQQAETPLFGRLQGRAGW